MGEQERMYGRGDLKENVEGCDIKGKGINEEIWGVGDKFFQGEQRVGVDICCFVGLGK